jgi:tape measure domain-containing protein
VAKYSADIEIAVRGGRQLDATIKSLNRLNNSINVVTRNAKLLEGKGFNVASIENYSRAVSKAERAVRKAAEGTNQERQAITQLVTAMNLENKARERKNILIAQEIANQRRVIATANAGVGMQGPALPAYMRSGPSSPVRGGRAIPGSPAALAAGAATPRAGGGGGGGSRIGGAISGAIIGGSFPLLFGQGGGAAAGGAIGGLAGGLLGPGGSFAGSLLGTLLGDLASKGNLVKKLGEDLGFSAQQTRLLATAFKQAGGDFDKFESSVQNIRGLSLDLESQANAIRLVSTLTEKYGGQIDKTTNAFTSALETGKVTQATLNQLTSQGIPIQQALADKYGVSRSAILQMAKDGKISVKDLTTTLIDLGNNGVNAAEKTKTGFDNLSTATGNLGGALSRLGGLVVSSLQGPLDWLSNRLASIVEAAARGIDRITDLLAGGKKAQASIQASAGAQALTRKKFGLRAINPFDQEVQSFRTAQEKDLYRRLSGTQLGPNPSEARTRIGGINVPGQLPPSAGGGGRKEAAPPEDRTQQLVEEFNAIVAIGQAEDRIRDLRFDGRDLLAAETELAKEIADIERDRNKALLGANYASEKAVITKIAEARIVAAQLESEDKIRAIKQERFEKELEMQDAVRSSVQMFTDMRKERELELQYAKTYGRLVNEGLLPAEAERRANFEKLVSGKLQELDLEIAITQSKILQGELDGNAVYKLQEKLNLLKQQKQAIEGAAAAGPGAGPTNRERLQGIADGVRGELNTLIDPINQVASAAQTIGTAFAESFKGVISGSMSAQTALATFFKSVGDYFLDMAAQMIAKWMQMIILNSILSLFPGGGGGGLGKAASGISFNPAAFSMPSLAANGASFANGIAKFANGGIVTSPTLFKFADGGTTKNGLMGEAGPEAIMPLKRGPDGRLGVSASTAAMDRYRPVPTGRGAGAGGAEATDEAGANAAGTSAIDVRYTVERINSVDYVTASQFEAGMQRAAQQGAQQGEQRTLRRLQNAPSARRRVGI